METAGPSTITRMFRSSSRLTFCGLHFITAEVFVVQTFQPAPHQVGQALFGHHPGAALRTADGRDAVVAHINGNRGAFHHNADVQVFEPAHILWLTFYNGPCLRRSGLPASAAAL